MQSRLRTPDDSLTPDEQGPEYSTVTVLECLRCRKRHSEQDIADGLYWPETFICSHCYGRMQQAPAVVSCFGKWPEKDIEGRSAAAGYSRHSIECRSLCPDRKICKMALDVGRQGR